MVDSEHLQCIGCRFQRKTNMSTRNKKRKRKHKANEMKFHAIKASEICFNQNITFGENLFLVYFRVNVRDISFSGRRHQHRSDSYFRKVTVLLNQNLKLNSQFIIKQHFI